MNNEAKPPLVPSRKQKSAIQRKKALLKIRPNYL